MSETDNHKKSDKDITKKPNYTLPPIREFDNRLDWFSTGTHRRNLPHWQLQNSTYFITFTVDRQVGMPFQNSILANIMVSHLLSLDKVMYLLRSYVIMPDHVHIIIRPINEQKLPGIMQKLKGCSARSINKFLKPVGSFWQSESFDHLIRNADGLRDKIEYIRNNPVTANLVNRAEDYLFSSFYNPNQPKS